MNRFASFLFAVFIITATQNAFGQNQTDGFSWAEIDFSESNQFELVEKTSNYILFSENMVGRDRIYFTVRSEFETGRAVMTNQMRQDFEAAKDSLRSIVARSHVIKVIGTNNRIANKQQAQLPQTERDQPEQRISADADLAETRSDVVEAAIVELAYGTDLNPSKIQGGAISMKDNLQSMDGLSDIQMLLARKSSLLIGERYAAPAADNNGLQDRMETAVNTLNEKFEQLKSRVAQNEAAIADLKDKDAEQDQRIESLQTAANNTDSGTKVGAIVGAGVQHFANQPTVFGEVGLRIGNVELAGTYSVNPNISSVELPDIGMAEVGRSGYRAAIAWYPGLLSTNRFEVGPEAAFQHGEDYIVDREEFLTVFESTQLGLAANAQLWKGLHGHVSAGYAVTNSAQASDLQFNRTNSRVRGGISLRLQF